MSSSGDQVSEVKGVGCGTILLAEDQTEVRSFLVSILEAHGYVVLHGADGMEAMEILAGHHGPVDLLVTDIGMAGMNGWELARNVLMVRPETKVLYMSGYPGNIDESLAGSRDFHFLAKPFRPDAVVRRVRELIGELGASGGEAEA